MARGKTDTFSDGISRMLGMIGEMRAYPDADDAVLDSIQQALVDKVRSLAQGPQALAAGQGLAPGVASPVSLVEPQSRGPVPGLDMREATAALDREMAGLQPTG